MAVAYTHSAKQQESVICRGSLWDDFPDLETVSRNGFKEKIVLENSAISITICLAMKDKESKHLLFLSSWALKEIFFCHILPSSRSSDS